MSILTSATSLFFTGTITTGFVAYNWGGSIVRSMAKSALDNVLGGSMEGMANAAASAAGNILRGATQNLDFTQISTSLGQNLADGLRNFAAGTGYQPGDFGKTFGQALGNEWNNFQTATGANPGQASSALSDAIQDIIKNFKAGKISETVADEMSSAFDGFADTIDMGEKGQRLGEEFRNFARESTAEAGKGMREALYNTFGEVLRGLAFDILPYFLAASAATVATPLAVYYLYRKALYNIGRPKLATEVHQRTILTPLTSRVGSAASMITGSNKTKPTFNPEITRRIEDLTRGTDNIRKNGGFFQNVLFYGPGGTGKTMISELIAKNSGMSYVKMSGGDLAQYIKRGEHVTELNKLMDKMNLSWRPWSSRPWILFIDEAESLCKDRSKILTSELLELQNAFLNRTGTESKKFMVILATNRMEDLDEAILTRMDHKIYIGPPAEQERVGILKTYIPKFFYRSEQAEFFTDPKVQNIAHATEGLTGRALFKLCNAIANKKATTDNRKLTQPHIDETVQDMVKQEKEVERRRALKEEFQIGPLPKPIFRQPAPKKIAAR